ncbi:NKG2-E type II integral membrane protein-like [Diprion similis]|uniref:NKG2-E type II integral membrane protein-like n=1 Tax=Diprion similis TaxID=362088 RepID=UPI001EF7787E|nr:NKG2-E type II integral membrane protein-like [Diprion similis]
MGLSFKSPCFQLASFIAVLGLFISTEARIDKFSDFNGQGYSLHMANTVSYKVYNERRTWEEARRKCIDDGARLAIIDTYEKVGIIGKLKPFNAYVWIGVSRSGPNQPWIIAHNGLSMVNIPWAPTKPWGSYNCLTVRGCNRGLSNEDCNDRKGFVCEKVVSAEVLNP